MPVQVDLPNCTVGTVRNELIVQSSETCKLAASAALSLLHRHNTFECQSKQTAQMGSEAPTHALLQDKLGRLDKQIFDEIADA